MNVLFIPSWFPSKMHPTLGNFVERHADAVAAAHEVTVIFPAYTHRVAPSRETRGGGSDARGNALPTIITLYFPKWYRRFPAKVRARVLEEVKALPAKPDVVHGHVLYGQGRTAAAAAELLDVPCLITEHWTGYLPVNRSNLKPEILAEARVVGDMADAVLPVSEDLNRELGALGIGKRRITIDNAVDTAVFKPAEPPERENFRWLHISSFHPMKNTEGLLDGFKRRTEQGGGPAELLIAGDGDVRKLIRAVRKRGLEGRVTIKGAMSPEGVAREMQKSDAFVLFSRYENLPCVIAEAHCCGLPVVSTDVGGISEMVTPENGILIQSEDTEALASAMLHVEENRGSYAAREISRKASARYGYPAVARVHTELYKTLIRERADNTMPSA